MNGIKTGLFISAGRSIFVWGKIFFLLALLCCNLSAADCCFFPFIYLLMFFSSCLSTLPWWKRAFAVRAAKLGLHTFSTAALQLLRVCVVFVCLHMPASLPPPPSFYTRQLWEWRERPPRCAFHLAIKRGHPGLTVYVTCVSGCLRVISVVVPPPPTPPPLLCPPALSVKLCHFVLHRHGQEGRPQADARVV